MNTQRTVCLRINSNSDKYTLNLYDGCKREILNVKSRCIVLSLCTPSPVLKLTVTPNLNQFGSVLYYNLDIRCTQFFELQFNFSSRRNGAESINNFYLYDNNYGMPIDGVLYFDLA